MEKGKIKDVVEMADYNIRLYTSHLESLRKIIELITGVKDTFKKIDIDYSESDEIVKMISFNALLTISLLDLLVVCKKLMTAENNWEKIFFIKQGYLIIYETIGTYNTYNKDISKLINTQLTGLKSEYELISENIKRFKKVHSYEDKIKNVRHAVAGHIDNDFINYYDTIHAIKGESELNAILAFISILKQVENLSLQMEILSRKFMEEQLAKEGIGTTMEEINNTLYSKLEALRTLIEKKILPADELPKGNKADD